ncbi:DUF4236 domain-containing protein [Pseudarthrobacter sp. C4D7]|uniref:DUF4236 domain-containing protein n=1 Tax=Pseudarthrobacter sp. C4D7 TaxID=2735268 RepID=UPI001C2F1521
MEISLGGRLFLHRLLMHTISLTRRTGFAYAKFIGGTGLGFRYRKSKSFGPVHITASKRGLSASVGTGPLRVTKSATGRKTTTVRVPKTGISYSTSNSTRRSTRNAAVRRSDPSRGRIDRRIVSDETWRQLLAPDGTPAASKFQRNFVRAVVARATGTRPSLMHLTQGQAANVLTFVGESPSRLNAGGRGVPQLEKAGTVAQWTMLGLLLLIVTVSSPAGFVLAAGIVGLMFVLRKRRRDRQAWEDATWSATTEESLRVPGDGIENLAADASPQDSSYAVPLEPIAAVNQPASSPKSSYPVSLGRTEWPNVEVVGEHAYGKAIKAALRASGALSARRTEGEAEGVQVELVAEPDNPYDSNAISVRWRGRVLGYLSREDALRYAQPIRRIIASGLLAATTARIWGYDDGAQLRARVTVALPEPELIVPLNEAPRGLEHALAVGIRNSGPEGREPLRHTVPPRPN